MTEKYKVTVNDLYIELKRLIENGAGDMPIKLSVKLGDCNHRQNLRALSGACENWILLMGY